MQGNVYGHKLVRGGGTHPRENYTSVVVRDGVQEKHKFHELRAIRLGILNFQELLAHEHVLIQMDSMRTKTNINRLEGLDLNYIT